ncbi:pectin acetylesterase-family hydrolase [Methylomonas sp. MED-D]|uniref:pectin acetylesterase-family hydrolase n=1 Tax=unclassified Methylomonas TaxID=2608980 RepID=UPI0008DA73B7|nr:MULTISPECIES: pectin acetylesterase-family hydrolase [unclassified Methylomonas]MDT4330319.1 pectin acetylesterase-family hydrolase [Methylomonas sp. MV1]NJA06541.1 hypothetical protein [Methylococcaceae bacterium WWC4]OHX37385.1 hypothetical protein BJL95_02350 [Methylomonas sp. LWB]
MNSKFWRYFGAAALLATTCVQAKDTWQEVVVAPGDYRVNVTGQARRIHPSCAFEDGYKFYLKPGNSEKLVVYFNGGGACWNYSTCSTAFGNDPSQATFIPSTNLANNPATWDGLLAIDNPSNPYKDWTIVFLPYCTGDVFIGAKETVYSNPQLSPNNAVPDVFTVHHRGFDNFLYVMNYLDSRYRHLDKILVSGSSAGGYGSTLNYPWIKKILGRNAKTSLVSDGSIGVLTDEFIQDSLFGTNTSWSIEQTLHPALRRLSKVTEGLNFIPSALRILANQYPEDRFSQYTNAYDYVQAIFWNLMQPIPQPLPDLATWSTRMLEMTVANQTNLPHNYRSYIDPGCDHTILSYSEFYTSALEGISFLDWIKTQTGESYSKKHRWRNLSCTLGENCGEETLTTDGIEACLNRFYSRLF